MASMDSPQDVPDTKFTLNKKERMVKMVKEEKQISARLAAKHRGNRECPRERSRSGGRADRFTMTAPA